MVESLIASTDGGGILGLLDILGSIKNYLLIFAGFSVVIFFHELGHFLAAKWCDVRVDKFAIGFGRAVFSYRKGMGFRWGSGVDDYRRRVVAHVAENWRSPGQSVEDVEPTDVEILRAAKELGYGETEYCFNWLPLGGYVKMLGQEDFAVDKTGELRVKADPRAFTHKPVGQRMIIVSAGVVMNLLFAAFVFMLVFMIGMKSPSAEIGQVQVGTPASRAGLRIGDRITQINGREIADRSDLVSAIVLSDPDEPLEIEYERTDLNTGQTRTEKATIRPEVAPGENILKIGVAPPFTTTVGLTADEPALPPDEQLKKGDEIIAVNGKPIRSFWEVQYALADLRGQWATLTVLRPGENGEKKELKIRRRAYIYFMSTGKQDDQNGHLLGFVPRRMYGEIPDLESDPTTEFRRGDVIVRWGGILAPRLDEIRKSIQDNPGQKIPVSIRRNEEEKTVTANLRASGWFGRKPEPLMAADVFMQEVGEPVVSDIVTEVTPEIKTPAAAIKDLMPRGSRITKVDGEPVANWFELSRRFHAVAGRDVQLSWQYEGGAEQSATLHVPQTIGTVLDLPVSSVITEVNGVSRKEVEINGRREILTADHWIGLREILRDFVGQKVTVTYELLADPSPRTAEVAEVTPEMLDTWTKRVYYVIGDVLPEIRMTTVRETNPFKAMLIGVRKTYHFIEQVYLTMKRMVFTRSMNFDQVSGPVGIFKMGSDFAAAGTPVLLYFLALISANLAVINFLPLPIVDGGLFVFLLIEKIKGSPISIRVQVATQVIGLALIISIFLYVTFQDLQKIFG